LRTAADAAPHDDEPEASVKPAPRSQIMISMFSAPFARANCTFVRWGNAAWRSIRGPSRRVVASSS
jgi:hypothetical protein